MSDRIHDGFVGRLVIDEAMEQFWRDGQTALLRQQAARLQGMFDAHASIVGPDGKVGAIDPNPMPHWSNRGP